MNAVQFYERVLGLLKDREWSEYRLARESKIPYSTWYNMKKRKSEPKLVTILKIISGLGISEHDFFHPDSKKLNLSEEEEYLVESFRKLPLKDRKHLCAYVEMMLKISRESEK